MTKKKLTNIGASVMGRLNKLARERREDVQLLLTRHANERLLYRLRSRRVQTASYSRRGAVHCVDWPAAPGNS